MEACAAIPRSGQGGTWITDDMKRAYTRLHHDGLAHSVEAWHEGSLAGGLYGVSLGGAFFGESMFAQVSEASKVAFATLVPQLEAWGIELIDCQVETEHLARFGARDWTRSAYIHALTQCVSRETRRGPWRFDEPGLQNVES